MSTLCSRNIVPEETAMRMNWCRLTATTAALTVALQWAALAAPTETLIYSFPGGKGGQDPLAKVVIDAAGALYATTYDGGADITDGTVVRLTPPAPGQSSWAGTTLSNFKNADSPQGAVLLAGDGGLYLTTSSGGKQYYGAAIELSPPSGGKTPWKQTTLHVFSCHSDDGEYPGAALIADSSGNLFTTTIEGGPKQVGTIVEITPAGKAKKTAKEQVIYAFTGGLDGALPRAPLVADNAGNLYTTTSNGGDGSTIVELSPPAAGKSTWTETTLYRFGGPPDGSHPSGAVVLDGAGNLYAATYSGGAGCADENGCGTIVKLSPPAPGHTTWSETVIYQFTDGADSAYPDGDVIIDANGNLYTTSYGSHGHPKLPPTLGAVIKLMPPAPGQTNWTEVTLHSFTGKHSDGAEPASGPTADSAGNLYVTTTSGGAHGDGTVVELSGTGFAVKN
jgi:hypothetical protein